MTVGLQAVLRRASLGVFIGLLAYMPLHIFVSTYLGTSFGMLDAAKVAKEVVLIIGFSAALAVSMKQPWFHKIRHDRLIWLILAYAGLTVLLAIIKPTDQDAEILGIVYNTRFLVFFLYGYLLVRLYPDRNIRATALRPVMIVAGLVILFGLLQYFIVPNTALSHVGYSRDNGVLPAFFIDDKPDLERVMSTIRDPNSLGSYLIIIGMLAFMYMIATKRSITRQRMIMFSVLLGLCLWLTFSRSALLGFIIACTVFFGLSNTRAKKVIQHRKKVLLTVTSVVIILGGVGFFAARNSYLVQNIVLHSDQSTTAEDPNQLRLRFWKESVLAAVLEPEGSGPGTAGLASIKNDKQGTVLNENYYLQILTEVGALGLGLFMAILVVVARRLYRQRSSLYAVALLASFTGLAFTNVLVHIWSNEAVAYTWWGLAGLLVVPSTANARTKQKI